MSKLEGDPLAYILLISIILLFNFLIMWRSRGEIKRNG